MEAVGAVVPVGAVALAVAALREARRTGGRGRGQAIGAVLLASVAVVHGLLPPRRRGRRRRDEPP